MSRWAEHGMKQQTSSAHMLAVNSTQISTNICSFGLDIGYYPKNVGEDKVHTNSHSASFDICPEITAFSRKCQGCSGLKTVIKSVKEVGQWL